nr:hypothetical protein [uncultured bacterium]
MLHAISNPNEGCVNCCVVVKGLVESILIKLYGRCFAFNQHVRFTINIRDDITSFFLMNRSKPAFNLYMVRTVTKEY